jgi:predicted CxxxxCH...CXXCH cytochrome family protein
MVWSNHRVIFSLFILGVALFSGKTAQAAPQYVYNCDFCHHMPPLDSASGKKEPGTGAVKGNHQSHAGATAATCVKCHGPALTATGHRDKKIQVQGNINSSPLVASYSRGFVNQTSVPPANLGTCSNVNCHFEQTTPAWGSASYSSPAACAACHGAPPTGGASGSSGSHARHDSYFPGTAQCVKCHPNRLVDANPFAHATSVSARIKVTLTDTAGAASGSYSGTGANFLPSQSGAQVFGACSNNYCHSTGNPGVAAGSLPAVYGGSGFASVTWGGGSLACNGCHGRSTANGMPDYANAGTPGNAASNSHQKHVVGSNISCNECHEKTTKNNSSIRPGALGVHLDKKAEVFFNLSGANKAGSYASALGSKSCSNTYCHGTAAIQWGGATLACNACHGANNAGDLSGGTTAGHALHVNSATLFTNLTGGSLTTAAAYAYSCKSCHPTLSHATGPASALSSAGIGGSALSAAQYTAGAASLTDSKGFKYTAGSCATNSCHNNGRGGAPLATLSWSAAASGACLSCHDGKQTGASASTLSAKHDRHMNPTTNALIGLNNGLNCVDCHAKSVSSNTIVNNKLRHVNGFNDYSGLRAGGSARYNATTKQCSNVYCHSNGNPGALVYANLTGSKTWSGSATLGCNGCHGRSNALGAPDYANGGAVPSASANSRAKHVAGALDTTVCSACHVKTVNASVAGRFKDYTAASYHLNATPNVYFSAAKAGATAAWVQASGTCNNVSCHGGTGSTVVWGASVNCQDCHGNGATASVADFATGFWNNGTVSKFQMTGTGSWADTGHGRPTASGAYPGSGNPAGNFTGVANFCEWCHDPAIGHNVSGNPFRLRNWSDATWGKNGACMICHATGSVGVTVSGVLRTSAANKVGSTHYGAQHSTALSGGQFCWDCHEPHGGGTANQYMVRPRVALTSDVTTGAPLTQSATAVVFALSATPTGTDYAKSVAPFNGVCNVCHTAGHYTATSGDATHNAGTRCISCHSHSGPSATTAFTAIGGDCVSCHGSQQGTGTRRVVGTDTVLASHHIQATVANQASCIVCHEQSAHQAAGDVAVRLYNQDTAAALSYDGTTATAANLESACNSCHDKNGASRLGANALKPFTDSGDNTVPAFIGWSTGKQAHGANLACFNCHGNSAGVAGNTLTPKLNGHGSATAKMLQFAYTATDTMTTTTNFCYNCHGTTIANGVTSPSIQAAVNLSASIGHKSAKCLDCHDNHSAKPGSHTAGPNSALAPVLNGVVGKGGWPATSPAMSTTWTGTGTLAVSYTAKPAATKEYEICFKCHAGSVPAPTGYTVGPLRMTDLGLEFNPANKSGHPVVANLNGYTGSATPKPLLAGDMVAPWTSIGTQTMTCSDCHGRGGTGAMGPHGSSVRWMLTGTNQAWPFTTTAGNGTATGTPWMLGTMTTGTAPNKLFCLNCHVVTGTNGVHDAVATSGKHTSWASTARGACLSCHIRVPHGAKTSRLLRLGTAAVLGRYAPSGNGAEVGTATSQVLSKYSKGTQTSNRRGSFTGVGCTEHSGGTDTW